MQQPTRYSAAGSNSLLPGRFWRLAAAVVGGQLLGAVRRGCDHDELLRAVPGEGIDGFQLFLDFRFGSPLVRHVTDIFGHGDRLGRVLVGQPCGGHLFEESRVVVGGRIVGVRGRCHRGHRGETCQHQQKTFHD